MFKEGILYIGSTNSIRPECSDQIILNFQIKTDPAKGPAVCHVEFNLSKGDL